MTYISLTPTLRYQMLTVTNCLVLPTIACRMHFAEQHATLDNVYETDYAEIVSDTPFDTVMQELSELLQRLFPENEFRSYAKCYLEILTSSEEMDYATLMSISKVLPHCSTSWWITYGSGLTEQWGIRIATLPEEIPVAANTIPAPQPPKKPLGQIVLSAIERIQQKWDE